MISTRLRQPGEKRRRLGVGAALGSRGPMERAYVGPNKIWEKLID